MFLSFLFVEIEISKVKRYRVAENSLTRFPRNFKFEFNELFHRKKKKKKISCCESGKTLSFLIQRVLLHELNEITTGNITSQIKTYTSLTWLNELFFLR
jgi:hypothetical protein